MRSVIFDLDGTLADTGADLLAAANATFAALGHTAPLGPDDGPAAMRGGRAMLRLGAARLRLGWDEDRVAAHYDALIGHYEQAIAVHTRLFPGAQAAVERLRAAGIATGICTNKPAPLAERLLRQLGVRDLFGVLVGAGTLPRPKPDPAPLNHAIAALGAAPGRSVLIGDTDTDRRTGANAGVPVVLVTFGPEGRDVARLAPAALLDHYDDLDRVLAPLIGP